MRCTRRWALRSLHRQKGWRSNANPQQAGNAERTALDASIAGGGAGRVSVGRAAGGEPVIFPGPDSRAARVIRAYCQGKLARVEGRSLKELPELGGTQLDAWLLGWREQHRESNNTAGRKREPAKGQ
jgi:ribosome modulation factor